MMHPFQDVVQVSLYQDPGRSFDAFPGTGTRAETVGTGPAWKMTRRMARGARRAPTSNPGTTRAWNARPFAIESLDPKGCCRSV